MKPVFASDVLKDNSPSYLSKNRYEVLRSRTMSGSENFNASISRERANSVKRKASVEICSDSGKRPNQGSTPTIDPQKLQSMDRKLKTIKGISSRLNEDAAKLKVDPALENVLRILCEFVDNSVSLQEDLVKACTVEIEANTEAGSIVVPVPELASSQEKGNTGNPSLRDLEPEPPSQNAYSTVAARKPIKGFSQPKQNKQPKPQKEPRLQAFHDAVKQSEKSTLVFNLNLGNHKTLNETTILKRATLALSAAAAKVEGNPGKPPSKDAVAALDDVMSVTENVTLFGKVTKPYVNWKNDKDPLNRTFFTIPVRYEFKDKDTKAEAETILRETCKVDCTTPYPFRLRHCIKQAVDHLRKDYPQDYIRVTVDTDKVALKISRKNKVEGWFHWDEPVLLPEEVLDIHARDAPDSMIVRNLPCKRVAEPDSEEMADS
jgi:hypothetical protein